MKYQPVGDIVLVQIRPPKKTSILIIKDRYDEFLVGDVLGIGNEITRGIEVGDVVLVNGPGQKVEGGTEESPYWLIYENRILSKVLEEANE